MGFRWMGILALGAILAGCMGATPGSDPQAASVARAEASRAFLSPTATTPASPVWFPGVHGYTVLVDGEPATGLVAVPEGTPSTLVVMAHGWGRSAETHRADLESLRAAGTLAVAMDFRGGAGAFKVASGVADTVAATLQLQAMFPGVERTLLYGWSMGAEVALLAALQAPVDTYDYVFAGSSVTDLAMFWEEAPLARRAIEAETGGPPTSVPQAYADRSPLGQEASLATRGIQRVFMLHAAADWPVPVEQAERMYDALARAGQPVSYYVITKDQGSSCLGRLCPEHPVPAGHDAGLFRLMQPFVQHRIDRLPDPTEAAVRGTYDGEAGTYDPSDVG